VRRVALAIVAFGVVLASIAVPAEAQEPARDSRVFAGALFGVSALSADATAETSAGGASVSMYSPENGGAVNLFAGVHLAEYFSLQGNWVWNRNGLTLISAFTPEGGGYYEQPRHSRQHAFVADGLIYFRRRESAVRPYLGTGLAIVRFTSDESGASTIQGITPPGAQIASTKIGLRSHVGIDIRLSRRLDFRYSFSETISGNPISPFLTPPGSRGLANFQNLFGVVGRF
jgi:Outer membrane protein beta-barrel domain